MKESDTFRKQFLFTTNDEFSLPWEREHLASFNLFYHPDLEFEHSVKDDVELYLLGFLFDYKNPEFSNKKILDSLSEAKGFDLFLESLSEYSGQFAIIYKEKEKLIILNDACAQREIYYDATFSSFGSQPKLLAKVLPVLPSESMEANEFYSSSEFLNRKEFIGETTHFGNILHLIPNHYIDINLKSVCRYYPSEKIHPVSIKEASQKACEMLKGYIKAASLRYSLYLGVTGGYDSRVLYLASLDVDCNYYVSRLSYMGDSHYDITISKRLTKLFNKKLQIITDHSSSEQEKDCLLSSVDFPRLENSPFRRSGNYILINGNISEIARNYYGYYKNLSPSGLAIINGYHGSKFVAMEYEKWLNHNLQIFSQKGYNVLDMFYWEERMGIWAAKAKTEMDAYGIIVYSPFCSNKLLTILLSTPRDQRDEQSNKLYDLIINSFSSKAGAIPVNPTRRKTIILLLKKIKLFNHLQNIKLRYRLLKYYR